MSESICKSEPDIKELDRRLVLATQSGLPLHARPYHWLATQLGVGPETVMQRLRAMCQDGRIRRIGVLPNHYRLGYVANGMAVWDIDDTEVMRAGALVGGMASVSHCYRRPRHPPDWPYNLFAMVHGHSRGEVLGEIRRITELLGAQGRAHDVLFSTRILKKTGLRIEG